LFIEVKKDFTTYGEEVKFGGGKVIRDGIGQSQTTRAEGGLHADHQCADRRLDGHLQGGCRLEGRPHRRYRQAGNLDTRPGLEECPSLASHPQ